MRRLPRDLLAWLSGQEGSPAPTADPCARSCILPERTVPTFYLPSVHGGNLCTQVLHPDCNQTHQLRGLASGAPSGYLESKTLSSAPSIGAVPAGAGGLRLV